MGIRKTNSLLTPTPEDQALQGLGTFLMLAMALPFAICFYPFRVMALRRYTYKMQHSFTYESLSKKSKAELLELAMEQDASSILNCFGVKGQEQITRGITPCN